MKSSGEVKLFAGILLAALVLAGIAVYPSLSGRSPSPPAPAPKQVSLTRDVLVPPWSHRKGDPKAPFVLVEFGDYQCPSCAAGQKIVDKILRENRKRLSLVFHPMVVNRSHINSPTLTMAAEAAALQGKFWAMHDVLYQNQNLFETTNPAEVMNALTKLAADAKLDVLRFRSDITGDAVRKAYEQDADLANRLEVHVTPTFFFVPPHGSVVKLESVPTMKDWLANPANWK
ncbi:MAG: DsbA family protein [Chthonomonadales bacterium]